MGSAGLQHFLTDVRVVDPDGGVREPGTVGQIQISGPNVTQEYWNRPDATESSFAAGGWFCSGNMGYTDEEGFVYISGRLKDMIIPGGENIYPAEEEQILVGRVRGHLIGRIARHKIPKTVTIVDELPRTASGNIRKADLRRKYAGN